MTARAQLPGTRVAALVLAGGRSSRMGRHKADVLLSDGQTMLSHVVSALEPLGIPIHLSVARGAAKTPVPPVISEIEDPIDFPGPLAAIAHALEVINSGHLLVVCCDQPLLSSELLMQLIESRGDCPTFLRTESGVECSPFPGVFPLNCLPTMRDTLKRGERSPRRFARSVQCHWIPMGDQQQMQMASFNSPNELEEAGLLETGR